MLMRLNGSCDQNGSEKVNRDCGKKVRHRFEVILQDDSNKRSKP